MNTELVSLTNLLKDILKNNRVSLTESIPPEIYDKYIFPYRRNIITSNIIPIEDLLSLEEIQWDLVQAHPNLTIEIIQNNFSKFDFPILIKNLELTPKLNLEELCQVLEANEINSKSGTLTSRASWEAIEECPRLTSELIWKYIKNFNLMMIFKQIDLKQISQKNILELLGNYYSKNDIDLISLINLKFPFDVFYKILSNVTTIQKPSHVVCKINTDLHTEFMDSYFEVYNPAVSWIRELELIYNILTPKGRYLDPKVFLEKMIEKLLNLSYVTPKEFTYLIDRELITKFPHQPIKYRRISLLFYQKAISQSIELDGAIPIGKLTLNEYDILLKVKAKGCYPSKILTISHFENVCTDYINQRQRNQYYSNPANHLVQLIIDFLIEKKDHPRIICDLYHQSQDSTNSNVALWEMVTEYNTKLYQVLPEQFLYLWFLDDFKFMNINFKKKTYYSGGGLSDKFVNLLGSRKFSQKFIRTLLESTKTTDSMRGTIILRQKLTPKLVNDFENKLDWNLLSFNSVWKEYPADNFEKIPKFDQKNFWLWATPAEKYDCLVKIKSPRPITIWAEDSNWVVMTNVIKMSHNIIDLNKNQNPYNCYASSYYRCPSGCRCALCLDYKVKALLHRGYGASQYRFRKKRTYGKSDLLALKTYRFLLSDLNIFDDGTDLNIITQTPPVLMPSGATM